MLSTPPLQAPLFWQICVLGWIGGLLSLLYPLPVLTGLGFYFSRMNACPALLFRLALRKDPLLAHGGLPV